MSLTCHDKIARDFAFLGSSSVLATTGSSGDGKNLAIWDALLPKHKAQTQSYKVHDRGGGYSLAFSKKHQLLVSGGRNGEICIFDIRQPKLLHTIQAHEMHVRSLYIDEVGRTLCSGSGEGDMKVKRRCLCSQRKDLRSEMHLLIHFFFGFARFRHGTLKRLSNCHLLKIFRLGIVSRSRRLTVFL